MVSVWVDKQVWTCHQEKGWHFLFCKPNTWTISSKVCWGLAALSWILPSGMAERVSFAVSCSSKKKRNILSLQLSGCFHSWCHYGQWQKNASKDEGSCWLLVALSLGIVFFLVLLDQESKKLHGQLFCCSTLYLSNIPSIFPSLSSAFSPSLPSMCLSSTYTNHPFSSLSFWAWFISNGHWICFCLDHLSPAFSQNVNKFWHHPQSLIQEIKLWRATYSL